MEDGNDMPPCQRETRENEIMANHDEIAQSLKISLDQTSPASNAILMASAELIARIFCIR